MKPTPTRSFAPSTRRYEAAAIAAVPPCRKWRRVKPNGCGCRVSLITDLAFGRAVQRTVTIPNQLLDRSVPKRPDSRNLPTRIRVIGVVAFVGWALLPVGKSESRDGQECPSYTFTLFHFGEIHDANPDWLDRPLVRYVSSRR